MIPQPVFTPGSPEYWDKAKAYLCKHDDIMRDVIQRYHGECLEIKGEPFTTLLRSIIGQQISVKAADSIWLRVLELFDGHIHPDNVLVATPEHLRLCGLSERKVEYLQAIAKFFMERQYDILRWHRYDDAEIIKELTSIRGVGQWTAEMFLIFALGRPDVYPLQDIGLLKAIFRHYNNGDPLDRDTLAALGEVWRPYRTVATWYLWRALDPVPVAY